MKNLILGLIVIAACHQGWSSFSNNSTSELTPLSDEPYVVVYGRKTCGYTRNTIKELKQSKIPYQFKTVDDKSIADQLHSRMRSAGIDTRRYNLPVVDVSNNLSIRPKLAAISDKYRD